MDIDELLNQLRELCTIVGDSPTPTGVESELAHKFGNLDEWLSRGGYPPEAWRRADNWSCDE